MKVTILAAVVGLAVSVAVVARADINVQWVQDSYTAFDVVITGASWTPGNSFGTGWEGTFTSPSGLWQLYGQVWGGYGYGADGNLIDVGNYGGMTFLGSFPLNIDPDPMPSDYTMTTQPYNDFFSPTAPIEDGAGWIHGFLVEGVGWHGWNPITISSMPVLADTTTWTWTAEFKATGPSLAPEPRFLSLGFLALLVFAPKRVRGLWRRTKNGRSLV